MGLSLFQSTQYCYVTYVNHQKACLYIFDSLFLKLLFLVLHLGILQTEISTFQKFQKFEIKITLKRLLH